MKNFVNLTPHTITIVSSEEDGDIVDINVVDPSGTIARVGVKYNEVKKINGVSIFQAEWGEIENLPQEQENTLYIVSSILLERVKTDTDRKDCFAPAELIRDKSGQIIGTKGLVSV